MPVIPPNVGAIVPTTRLPNESAKAYAAFRAYAEMGAGRSLSKLGQKRGKNRATFDEWSRKFQWQERLRTWDAEEAERQAMAKAEAALAAASEREKRRTQVLETVWTAQQKIAERLMQMLAFPVAKTTVKNEDGTTTIVMPGKWNYADITRMANAVAQLGAFSTGMTKKLTDPETGKPVGEEDDTPRLPVGMKPPTIIFEVYNAPEQPKGSPPPSSDKHDEKKSAAPAFQFGRSA